jgi:hypothetical protein
MISLTGVTNFAKYTMKLAMNLEIYSQANFLVNLKDIQSMTKELKFNNLNLIFWDKIKSQKEAGIETHFNANFKLRYLKDVSPDSMLARLLETNFSNANLRYSKQ